MASSKLGFLLVGLVFVLAITFASAKLPREYDRYIDKWSDNRNDATSSFRILPDGRSQRTPYSSMFRPDYRSLSKSQQKVEEDRAFEAYLWEHLDQDIQRDSKTIQKISNLKNIPRPKTRISSFIAREIRSLNNTTHQTKSHFSKKYLPSNSKRALKFEASNLFVNSDNRKQGGNKEPAFDQINEQNKSSVAKSEERKDSKKHRHLIKKNEQMVKKYKHKYDKMEKESVKRNKRTVSVVNSEYISVGPQWGSPVWLGSSGEVALRVRTASHAVVFRAEARSLGHVAFALGNDAVLAWLDEDGIPNILDCHLVGGIPMSDYSQDYELMFGLRNHTHLVVEFRRPLDTCDPDDIIIGAEPIDVQWALGPDDPRGNGWGGWLGLRPLQFLGPRPPPPPPAPGADDTSAYLRWDVMMKDVVIPENMATMFWCKVFKAPTLGRKHHVAGHVAAAGPRARHMVLHECAVGVGAGAGERTSWERWAAGPGAPGPDMPADWAACLTPVAAWAVGSKGEMFPGHVGIPLGDPNGVVYYMLEIHYENPSLQKVVDNSGLTILYTSELREHDAGIMVTGITVSALHVLPADQKKYRSAGYCSEPCTTEMLPTDGINVVSVLLHAHSAGRKLSLRHIRNGQELPKISEDEKYDYKNQQSKMLQTERNVQQGDALVMECTYDTTGRGRPTLGGYSSKQEMCLSFILHYPRIPLAGCYSMTPVKEFFETFGVKEFYNVDMKQVESMFLTSGSLEGFPELLHLASDKNAKDIAVQGDDQGVNLLRRLVIKEPPEFRNKTFIAHLNEIPWSEPLLTKRIEDTLYKGKHMTFCRKRDDTIAVPIEISIFPNFSEVAEDPSKQCHYKSQHNSSTTLQNSVFGTLFLVIILSMFAKC